ncbi:MAG: 4-hydroxy-tetrahydrodipicolinate synthase [Phycisphaerae bacterium]|nr:4-hydroxy-tetrahydrodipicolinate synthase [Phycisphaerae bacterium]
MELTGSMVALVTPFADGAVDWDALAKLVDFQLESGTQGLVPCGTTGESPTLSNDEHDKVIEFVVERSAGRVPVIAGTGSNSTTEAIDRTQHARDAGADATLQVNPYYNKPTQQGMFEHVAAVGEVGLPIVLYNIPGRTGIELAPETLIRMYEQIDAVVAVKEATGKLDTASAVAAGCDMTILSGDDSMTLGLCAVGGSGVISVVANLLPAEVRAMCDAIAEGDFATARERHQRLFPLFKGMLSLETNPIPIKAAMAMAGLCRDELRLPMTPLSEANRLTLAGMLRPFGIGG